MATNENIIPSLFGLTPDTYQQQRALQLAAEQQKIASAAAGPGTMLNPSLQPLYAQAAQRGQMMGTALGGIFGMEDPQLKMVRDVTQMRQQFDTTTPEGLQSFAQALAAKGYTDLSVQAMDKSNQLMKTGAEAQTAQQKISQEKKLREELNNLGENASDEDVLRVVRKFGTPDQVMKAVQASLDKKATMQLKIDAANEAKSVQEGAKLDRATNTIAATQDAAKLVGLTTSGIGSVLNMIPGTDAKNLQAKLETIKANLAADMLADMKSQSKTGASGLGALNKAELIMIQSARTSLDPAQSPGELKKALEVVNKYYSARAGLPYTPLYSTNTKQEKQTQSNDAWQLVPNTPASGIPK